MKRPRETEVFFLQYVVGIYKKPWDFEISRFFHLMFNKLVSKYAVVRLDGHRNLANLII